MRNRSNSGVRLDLYRRMVYKTIMVHQHPVSGLLPASPAHKHAWIRDNVYSSLCIWALALCYKKKADINEDRVNAFELEMATVKLMRGLLKAMMRQVAKVEKFKYTQKSHDSIHAKFAVMTGLVCVGDSEWGHLQIDAISLFLLQLAQMTASGLQIIYSLDEVTFIQNLVFYIQLAFRTPDFGMWERGDKTNHGVPELNATSIGMARAALEAMNGLDLLGSRGGPDYIINVMPDESQQCLTILHSVLPRESNSKETDAGLLSIISYPAFAVDKQELIDVTKKTILEKLKGRYGICRFLRDGYKTAKEDPNRLHYFPVELQNFEKIECEWPMFFAYLVLDGLFTNNQSQVEEYMKRLEEVMVKGEDGILCMPELYAVPFSAVDKEVKNPGSQDRIPMGKIPQMWGQSLYVVCKLIQEGFVSTGEIDPLNRRLVAEPKPDVVVQVVVLAEDKEVQDRLLKYDLKMQTIKEVSTAFHVYQANILSFLFNHLGKEDRLGLTGRPTDGVGVLATSKIYMLGDHKLVFFPQFVDQHQSYLPLDTSFLVDMVKTDVTYLGSSWNMLGRPVMVVPIRKSLLDANGELHFAIISTIKKLQTGYLCGTRVSLGNLADFSTTSCVGDLSFLVKNRHTADLENYLRHIRSYSRKHSGPSKKWLGGWRHDGGERDRRSFEEELGERRDKYSGLVKGIVKRSMSIQIEADDLESLVVESSSGTPGSIDNIADEFITKHLKDNSLTVGSSEESPGLQMSHGIKKLEKFDGSDLEELLQQLVESDSITEQADIIHYLYLHKGPDWETGLDKNGESCKVTDLLRELYETAGRLKLWWLVRHTAGLLRMKVEDLAKAASDIIVRQKQLAVGLPPEPREKIITRPMRTEELSALIHEACAEDSSTAMLTQELLVYLAMYIRTEPKLFKEMLRIRVGLIIQLMASELALNLNCTSGEEVTNHLLNLSPYEMKLFLHHILSGKEFFVDKTAENNCPMGRRLSIHTSVKSSKLFFTSQNKANLDHMRRQLRRQSTLEDTDGLDQSTDDDDDDDSKEKKGQWIRRRRLDGALNRVPVGFYTDVWKLLKRCHGITFSGHTINQTLTKEMTEGEMKFALEVESMLNKIPLPKYRQLCVETIVMLSLIVEHDGGKCFWNQVIDVDQLVHHANDLFLQRQREMSVGTDLPTTATCLEGISDSFYDCAPSGRFGTMSHICRSIVQCLMLPCKEDGNLDCIVQ